MTRPELGTIENLGFDESGTERRRRLAVIAECPKCGGEILMWSETDCWTEGSDGRWHHEEFDAMSTGECCGDVFVDWWEGTFRLER